VGGSNGSNGTLWGHGWWNADWMPMFANSDIYGGDPKNPADVSGAFVVPQVQPTNVTCQQWRASGFSASGCLAGLADGSVRNVTPSVTAITWKAALTPNGGEVLPGNW